MGFYDFENPIVKFNRHNENITYSIEDVRKKYLLRIYMEAQKLNFTFFKKGVFRKLFIAAI